MPTQRASTIVALLASAAASAVLGAATLGLAQTSPSSPPAADNATPPPISQERIDAAMQRLRERQEARRHAAATQPTTRQASAATQPAGAPAAVALTGNSRALSEENQRLRDQMARLIEENNRLRQQLADATGASSEQARTASEREGNYDHQNTAPADNFPYGGYYNNPPIFIIPGGVSLGGIPSTQPAPSGTSTGTRPPDDRNPLHDNSNANNTPSMPNHAVNPPPNHTINPPPNTVVNPPRHGVVNPPRNVVVNPPPNHAAPVPRQPSNPPANHVAPTPQQPQNPPANHAGSTAR